MFDFSEMHAEQLEARKAELLSEMQETETRDALSTDDLEARKAEIEAIDQELAVRAEKAAEEAANKAQPLMTEIMREMIVRSEQVEHQQKELFNTNHPTEEWK